MINKTNLIATIIIIVLSCQNKSEIDFDFDSYDSMIIKSLKQNQYTDSLCTFIFLNNPKSYDSNYSLVLFVNDKIIYKGKFSFVFKFKRLKNMDSLTHMKLWIYNKEGINSFQDKSVFHWKSNYKVMYAGFFPDNESTDQVHFIPHENFVIQ